MNPSTPIVAITLLASMLVSVQVQAQDEQPPEVVEARREYNEGTADYERGRYEAAHVHFQRAYEISNLAPLLFNAATTLDRLFRLEEAIASYRTYLQLADAEHIDYVSARIHRLEQRAAAPNQYSREPEALEALEPLPAALAPPPPSQLAPILVMAGGAVVALSSIAPGLMAIGIRGDLRERCNDGICTEADQADLDKMDRLALTSDLLVVAGVGIAVGGLIWMLLRRPDSEESPVALSCTTDGCDARATFAF